VNLKKAKLKLNCENLADIDLLRLMAAFNDLTLATRHIIEAFQKGETNEPAEAEKSSAERLYYFRLICGHLNEGLAAFRSFQQHSLVKKVFDKVSPDERRHFGALMVAADPQNKDSFYKKVLNPLRSEAAFHYQQKPFQDSYRELFGANGEKQIPTIICGERYVECRYTVADNVLANMYGLHVGDDLYKLQDFVEQIITIQTALTQVIGIYLANTDIIDGELEQ